MDSLPQGLRAAGIAAGIKAHATPDLGLLLAVFGSDDASGDLDGDGIVAGGDLGTADWCSYRGAGQHPGELS